MKRVLWLVIWLTVFAAAGAILLPVFAGLLLLKKPMLNLQMFKLGAEIGADALIFAFFFGVLPGLRRSGRFGTAQGIWVVFGFAGMLVAAGIAAYNLLFLLDLVLTALHRPQRVDFGSSSVLAMTALEGECAGAFWVLWYVRGFGLARLTDGAAAGIAWRAAPRDGYAAAALCALGIISLVMLLYHFLPPDLNLLNALPMAHLFDGPAVLVVPLLLMVTLMAPLLEEFVFRGVAFAGFAVRLGTLWAAVITTVMFIVIHAPEKIHYLPGFIDVGMMAAASCWLRIRFASIRPGMLLHVLYNAGLMLAAGMTVTAWSAH